MRMSFTAPLHRIECGHGLLRPLHCGFARLVSDDDQWHGAALKVALLLDDRGNADALLG